MNSPTHPNTFQKQALLEEALLTDSRSKSLEHYGQNHLERVLGEHGMARLLDVNQWGPNAWYVPSETSESVSHLVIGFDESEGRRVPAMLLLAGCGPHVLESTLFSQPAEQMSADLLRVRSGLMRRETAELFVEALQNRGAPSLDEGLQWSVVPGPTIDQTVRDWLGQWDGTDGCFLRRLVGFDLPTELGRDVQLTALWLTRQARPRHLDCRAFGPALIEPPQRYYISGTANGGHDGLPPEYGVWVRRDEADQSAIELAEHLEATGQLAGADNDGQYGERDAAAIVADNLWFQFGHDALGPGLLTRSYGRGFTRSEISSVMDSLQREGLRDLRLHDWRYEVPKGSNPYFDGMGMRQRDHARRVALPAPGGRAGHALNVTLWSAIPLPLHLPKSEWPDWAHESLEMLEEDWEEQEAQTWLQRRAMAEQEDMETDELDQ